MSWYDDIDYPIDPTDDSIFLEHERIYLTEPDEDDDWIEDDEYDDAMNDYPDWLDDLDYGFVDYPLEYPEDFVEE